MCKKQFEVSLFRDCVQSSLRQLEGVSCSYGRMGQMSPERDRRIFTPVPQNSESCRQTGLQSLSSLERINSRIEGSFKFEKHYIRGKAKMTLQVGLALGVMMALAVGQIKAGR